MSFRFDSGSVSSFVMNSLDLVRGGGRFRRPLPNSMPVDSRSGGSTGADDVKHELGPVVVVSMRLNKRARGMSKLTDSLRVRKF